MSGDSGQNQGHEIPMTWPTKLVRWRFGWSRHGRWAALCLARCICMRVWSLHWRTNPWTKFSKTNLSQVELSCWTLSNGDSHDKNTRVYMSDEYTWYTGKLDKYACHHVVVLMSSSVMGFLLFFSVSTRQENEIYHSHLHIFETSDPSMQSIHHIHHNSHVRYAAHLEESYCDLTVLLSIIRWRS